MNAVHIRGDLTHSAGIKGGRSDKLIIGIKNLKGTNYKILGGFCGSVYNIAFGMELAVLAPVNVLGTDINLVRNRCGVACKIFIFDGNLGL